MKLLKHIYYSACSMLPTSSLTSLSPVKTLFPYQHLVSDEDLLHIKHLYAYKNVRQFKKDIDFLLKHFKPVSAEQIADAVANQKELPPRSFLITFDDGFREAHDVIAPILYQKGVPAIFFINPAFIDNKELFYRCKISLLIEELSKQKEQAAVQLTTAILHANVSSFEDIYETLKGIKQDQQSLLDDLAARIGYSFEAYLKKQQPFLTSVQVKELDKLGFTIGAHSWNHPYYDLLNVESQLWETVASADYVSDMVAAPHRFFSFPHYDNRLPQSFFNQLSQADSKIDLLFGTQNQKLELQNKTVHRFNSERPEIGIRSQVNGILMYCIMQKAFGRHKIERV